MSSLKEHLSQLKEGKVRLRDGTIATIHANQCKLVHGSFYIEPVQDYNHNVYWQYDGSYGAYSGMPCEWDIVEILEEN